MGFGLDYSIYIQWTRIYKQYIVIADLHNLQFTGRHQQVIISRILVTELKQFHCD
jgi:hypothetical protein